MKTILVTGGAGFLGSHIAEHLLRAGHRVAIIDSLEGGTEDNVPVGAHFMWMDICDEAAINRLFGHIKFDAIVHCAAFASENLSHHCALHTVRSIVQGSTTLLNAAVNQGTELLVNLSSIAVYGLRSPPYSEQDTPTFGAEPYGAAKACVEQMMVAAERHFGIKAVTFRPHNIIGIRQSLSDQTRNVASIFVRQAISGKPLTIHGSGLQSRAFSPVLGVASVIAASVDRPDSWSNTYNIGGNRIMRVYDLANIICELAGVKPEFEFLPERDETFHAHSSHDRVQAMFPLSQFGQQTIEDCLREMIDEARSRPLPPIAPLPRIEIQKNLPAVWNRPT